MNDYGYIEEAIASAELSDRDYVAPEPIATSNGNWNEFRIGRSKMIMHMPGSEAYSTFDVLKNIDARKFRPKSDTYVSVPHQEIYEEVRHNIERFLIPSGINITEEICVLGKGKTTDGPSEIGEKMFGLIGLSLNDGSTGEDRVKAVIGMQNGLGGSSSLLVAGGGQVSACDNLSFNGDLSVRLNHSKNVVARMLAHVREIIERIPERFQQDVDLYKVLKETSCTRDESRIILNDLVDCDAFENFKQLKSSISHLNIPRYSVFANDNSLWAVYNAITWGIKQQTSPLGVIGSTSTVNEYFRERLGLKEGSLC